MNRMPKEKEDALIQAFLNGMSLRAAAQKVGVAKSTAARFRAMSGGMDAFRILGAKFKLNRWESSKK